MVEGNTFEGLGVFQEVHMGRWFVPIILLQKQLTAVDRQCRR